MPSRDKTSRQGRSFHNVALARMRGHSARLASAAALLTAALLGLGAALWAWLAGHH